MLPIGAIFLKLMLSLSSFFGISVKPINMKVTSFAALLFVASSDAFAPSQGTIRSSGKSEVCGFFCFQTNWWSGES